MRVFSNTAVAIDGRIGVARGTHAAIGSVEDRRRMDALRSQADAVLVGGATFRSWPRPMVDSGRSRPMINAVLSRGGIVHAQAPEGTWPAAGVELHLFGGRELNAMACQARFGATVHQDGDPSVAWVLDELEALGCGSVLVEGGGRLLHALLAAGRLDELFITLCPRIMAGEESPSLVDGLALDRGLRLLDVDRGGDELYLHYELETRAIGP
jgi:5-amino-6-(5-phosphoribosylamino)uracil reductase